MAGVVADRVIVELEAKLDRYEANVRRAEATFDRATRSVSSDARRMEREVRASTAAIATSLTSAAGLFATAFSVQRVAQLADSYTRFTNQLKVAGLEGQNLATVQERLFGVAQRNGVELEAVGTLYSRAAQNQKELGASTQDLIGLTRAVAASLRISGTSTTEASGALLQLGQALGSPRIQAEEFNSLLDTMQPLLRGAAKFIDGTGGSLSGLTRKIKDTNGAGVSNIELFRAINLALADLEKQASSSSLTISGAYTNLTNAITKYIGETDRANGATAAVTGALNLLANNLDTSVEALTVIAAVLGARYAASAVTATAATLGKAAADVRATETAIALASATGRANAVLLGEAAAANIAAQSVGRLAVAQGLAARAGAGLLGIVGGPVGAATLALGAAVYYVATASTEAEAAAEAFAKGEQRAAQETQGAADAADKLATAHGKARDQALALARAEAENIKQKLASARASLVLAQAEDARQQAARLSNKAPAGSPVGVIARGTRALSNLLFPASAKTPAGRQSDELKGEISGLQKALKAAQAAIDSAETPAVNAPTVGDGKKKGRKKGAGASGPSAAEIESRFNDELVGFAQRTLSAREALAANAEDEAELAGRSLELERIRTLAGIKENKDYSAAQKARLAEQVEALADAERARIEFNKRQRLEQEAQDLADAQYEVANQALQTRLDEATTLAERRQVALDILALEQRHRESALEAVIASETATDAEKERARIALEGVRANSDAARRQVERQNEGPLARYRRGLDDPATQVEQAVADKLDSIDDAIADTIADRIGVKDPFLKQLLQIFIQQNILKPLYDAIAGASGGGGGGVGGFFGSILKGVVGGIAGGTTGGGVFAGPGFGRGPVGNPPGTLSLGLDSLVRGRASGGHVNAGNLYRINETGIEGFQPAGSGKVIPLGRMNKAGGAGGVVIHQAVHVDASGSVNPDGYAEHIVKRVRQETVSIVGAASRSITAGVPARVAQYQRDGL